MDDNNIAIIDGKEVKKRGRGGKFNFPNAIEPGTEDPEVVRSVLSDTLRWYERGIDSRPATDEEVYERLKEYFQTCVDEGRRPTVESMCLSLGYAKSTVCDWKNGNHQSQERSNVIKKAFDSIAAFDAGMAVSGKLNPVLYFFRAKNYYDMRDVQDVVVQPKQALGSDSSPDDIASRYQALPDD